jgi:predicted Zn-dependent peptidase
MYEDEGEGGYSHFFEHIVFRNINRIMSGELYRELDRHALTFSGTTYNEMIQLSLQGSKKHFKKALDILFLALSPLVIKKEEFEGEKERVKREIREDTYSSSVDALAQKSIWRATSLENTITGKVGTLSNMSMKKLSAFRDKILTEDNVFFYLTGSFSKDDEEYLKKKAESLRLPRTNIRKNIAPLPLAFFNREPSVFVKKADYCKVKISFDVNTERIKKEVRDVIYDILFQGDSSRIFLELSEKKGFVYSFDANFEEYANVGVISLSFETSEKDFFDALSLALNLILSGFSDEELAFAKAPYTENFLFLLDDAEALNFNKVYETHFLSSAYSSLEERRQKYLSLTLPEIVSASEEIFRKENLTVAVKHKKGDIEAELKRIIDKAFSFDK